MSPSTADDAVAASARTKILADEEIGAPLSLIEDNEAKDTPKDIPSLTDDKEVVKENKQDAEEGKISSDGKDHLATLPREDSETSTGELISIEECETPSSLHDDHENDKMPTELEESSSSTNTSEHFTKSQRSVSFGTLHVREFPVAVGDNPSVQCGGPPLRLEYQIQQEEYVIPLHEYEDRRQERRKSAELRVPPSLRREWVGHDPAIERQVALHQRQRMHSVAMHEWDDWNYALERVYRGLSKRILGRRRKQEEPDSLADQWYREYKQQERKPTTKR